MRKQFILLCCFLFLGVQHYPKEFHGNSEIKSKEYKTFYGKLNLSEDGQYYFNEDQNGTRYLITNHHDSIYQSLKSLDNNDTLYVTGEKGINSSKKETLRIENIDRIGLHRLLGAWYIKNEGTVNIDTYSQISFFPENKLSPIIEHCQQYISSSELRFVYSVVPGNDQEWVLFLTYCSKTHYGKININGDDINLKIFNENGNLNKELLLQRKFP